MSTGVLIDAGKSRKGFSYYGSYRQCAYKFRLAREFTEPSSPPLLIGTLGHLVQAHYHARNGIAALGECLVNGKSYTDENHFMRPLDALDAFCSMNDEYQPHYDLVREAFSEYARNPPRSLATPIEVETELVGAVGRKKGVFGYWLLREDVWDELDADCGKTLPAADGSSIEVTKIGVRGHPKETHPIYLSRRLDLVTQNSMKDVTVIDHKHKQNIFDKGNGYVADMGFTAIWELSFQKWSEYLTGLEIHAIGVNSKNIGKVRTKSLSYSKVRAKGLPHFLLRTAREIATLERDEAAGRIDRTGWPPLGSLEVGGNCVSIYKDKQGWTCPFAYHCLDGRELKTKEGDM